jgi:membrane protease YdiL (CAAX protease family)
MSDNTRRNAALEMVFFVLWLWALIWIVIPTRSNALIALCGAGLLAFMAGSLLSRGPSPATMGLAPRGFWRALAFLAAPTLLGVGAVAAAGLALEAQAPGDLGGRLIERLASYPLWALAQQFLVQSYAHVRLREAFGRPWPAIVATGVLFSLFHMPNLMLVGLTLPAGLLWAWAFSRRPNLYALALSHAALGSFVSKFLHDAYWAGKSVGPLVLFD